MLAEAAGTCRGRRARPRDLSEGDIFERVDARADVYVLKDVLHDWDDERCAEDPADGPRGDAAGARVVLVENLQERNGPTRSPRWSTCTCSPSATAAGSARWPSSTALLRRAGL